MTNPFDDLEVSDCLLVVGSNTTVAHPMVGMRLLRRKRAGGLLIVADPRRTTLAEMADIHLRLRPGTDVPLFNGLMHIIHASGWHKPDFIEARTENFPALLEAIAPWTPEATEAVTGVPRELLFRAARAYATAAASSIVYCLGITQHRCGVNNVRVLADLAMLCGQIGRPGTGVNPLRGQNNVQGACDMGGLPDYYPGYQKAADPDVRAAFARAWHCPQPTTPGLTSLEMMEALHKGTLKGMIILGENPVVSDPDANHVKQALGKAEFLLCIDIFPTPTTELAHLTLPGASFAESEGTFTNSERRVQRVRQALPPLAGRSNSRIIQELSGRMGYVMPPDSPAAVFDEMCALTPSLRGMSHARLDRESLCWPCPDKDHPGTPMLHKDHFVRGKGLFAGLAHTPPAELPDADYPLLLNTGMGHSQYLTGTMTRRCPMLERELPHLVADMHPDDAGALGLREGSRIRVSSRRGTVAARAHLTDRVPAGTIFAPLHFAEAPINALTIADRDPVSKTPEFKICAVRVEKV